MKLVELNPHWVSAGGSGITKADGTPVPGRRGIGVTFDCPCGCGERSFVAFANPLDGNSPVESERPLWQRSGETFEALTLHPSILKPKEKGGCGWHGWIRAGEVVSA